MLDVSRVIEVAFEMEHYAAGLWVRENRQRYVEGIFAGLEPVDNPDGEGGSAPCADK